MINTEHLTHRCDFGYTGLTCDIPVVPHLTTMMEQFVDDSSLNTNNALHIKGASLSFRCGVLSSGKSLVFEKDGPRRLVTTDLNTTDDRYDRFMLSLLYMYIYLFSAILIRSTIRSKSLNVSILTNLISKTFYKIF